MASFGSLGLFCARIGGSSASLSGGARGAVLQRAAHLVKNRNEKYSFSRYDKKIQFLKKS